MRLSLFWPVAFLLLGQQPRAHVRHAAQGQTLPDTVVTPGDVMPIDLHTICTQSTRVRRHVTRAIRLAAFRVYGIPYTEHAKYELDHLIPLEAGGSNSLRNLWPQPLAEAHVKDSTEYWVHQQVCGHGANLQRLQHQIARDWTQLPTR